MANTFAEDSYDSVSQHRDDNGATPNAGRHHPDATMRSAFKTSNINTGLAEKQRQPYGSRSKAAGKASGKR